MTAVTRTVKRESPVAKYDRGKSRPVIVTLEPPGTLIGFRLKGTRKTYRIHVGDCFALAVRAHAEAERERKKRERLARRKLEE
jgi:hypothetical protein